MPKAKGHATPIRFNEDELEMLEQLAQKSGLNRSEIVRRCVRFLALEAKRRGSMGFIVDELGPMKGSYLMSTRPDSLLSEKPPKKAGG